MNTKTLSSNLYALQGNRTDQEMAWIIGAKGRSTWADRKKHPEHLTVAEINALSKRMKTPVNDILFWHIERG